MRDFLPLFNVAFGFLSLMVFCDSLAEGDPQWLQLFFGVMHGIMLGIPNEVL